jgi:hypothetical protein
VKEEFFLLVLGDDYQLGHKEEQQSAVQELIILGG